MAGLRTMFHLIRNWWFNTGRQQNSKEQEVEKTFCLVKPPLLHLHSSNSSQISTDTSFWRWGQAGVVVEEMEASPDGASQKGLC